MQPYKRTTLNGKQIDTHRKVMELYLGRKLRRDEHVHHINGDKRDNRIENLMVVTPQEHVLIHKQKYPLVKSCAVCGKEFTPHKTKRKRAVVCSNECKRKLDIEHAKKRKRPIIQLSLDGLEIKTWDSARDIQIETGYFESNINKCCNHHIKSYKGYKWEYKVETA